MATAVVDISVKTIRLTESTAEAGQDVGIVGETAVSECSHCIPDLHIEAASGSNGLGLFDVCPYAVSVDPEMASAGRR